MHLGVSLDVEEEEEKEFNPLSLPDPDKFSAFISDEGDNDDERGEEGDVTVSPERSVFLMFGISLHMRWIYSVAHNLYYIKPTLWKI